MNIDNTLLQKYAPVIASALILIVPAADVLAKNPTLVGVLQFAALVAATVATFQLSAPWKQIAEWAGVIVAAILPLAITGTLTWANWALVVVAVVKALATHLGIALRRDQVTDPLPTATLPYTPLTVDLTAAVGPDSAIVPGDDLANPTNPTAAPPADDDEPGRHVAGA